MKNPAIDPKLEKEAKGYLRDLLNKAILQKRFSGYSIVFEKPTHRSRFTSDLDPKIAGNLVREMLNALRKEEARKQAENKYTVKDILRLIVYILESDLSSHFDSMELPYKVERPKLQSDKKIVVKPKSLKKSRKTKIDHGHYYQYLHHLITAQRFNEYIDIIFDKIFYPQPLTLYVPIQSTIPDFFEELPITIGSITLLEKNDLIYITITDKATFEPWIKRTPAFQDYIRKLRTFLGLSIACDLFLCSPPNVWLVGPEEIQEQEVFFRSSIEEKTIYLDRGDDEIINYRLVTSGDLTKKIFSTKLKKDISLSTYKVDLLREIFEDKHPKDTQEFIDRIRSASEWYYESLKSENESVRFILLTIVVESLLGDEKPSETYSTTEKLADRIAFLTTDNQLDRIKIRKRFKKIYDTRSRLVHRRKTRLEGDELAQLTELERVVKRLLYVEAKNINLLNQHNV